MKLNVKACALACGLTWGIGIFILTWWTIFIEGNFSFLSDVYRGYSVSPLGSVIGFAWAFVDGLVGGAIFAGIYNFFVGKFTSSANV